MEIKNHSALVRGSRRREDILSIVRSGIEAVLPQNVIGNALKLNGDVLYMTGKEYDLKGYRHIYVAGGGKASGTMALELEKLLGGRITAGIVNDRYSSDVHTNIIKVNKAGHPLPTQDGVRGVKMMLDMLSDAGRDDLVIFLISGGGSALLPYPAGGIGLEDMIRLTDSLLRSGARIAEINVIRKHISMIKGGMLLRAVNGAEVLSLVVSDVVGDDISFIASGPTAPDGTTYSDAINILRKYDLYWQAPETIRKHLEEGAEGIIAETPKPGDRLFDRVTNVIIASNIIALKAAGQKAQELGYTPLILGSYITGESKDVALVHAGIARECHITGTPLKAPAAIISGGETTVTIRGRGKGGRNEEFVLGFLQGYVPGTTVVSIDTDGIDGLTDVSGAIADETTMPRAIEKGLSIERALADNSSYDFFYALDDLVITGPTGTNVSDMRVILVYGPIEK